jgi:hypothetical protein
MMLPGGCGGVAHGAARVRAAVERAAVERAA